MTQGDRVLDSSGKWLVNANGEAVVKDGDDECPECCGGCALMSGRLSLTFSGLSACIHSCFPNEASDSCISIHSTVELNREFILDYVDSFVVDGVTYCRFQKITSGALEIDRWAGDGDPCFDCRINAHDHPDYSTNSEDIITSVLLRKNYNGVLLASCTHMSFIDTVGNGQEYDLFLQDSFGSGGFDVWMDNRFSSCGPWWYFPICRNPTLPPGTPAYQLIAGVGGKAMVSQEGI